jgi:hypothetical protein
MPIRVTCPGCGKTIAAPDNFAGKSAKCPGCKAAITIPAAMSLPKVMQPDAPPPFDPIAVLSKPPVTQASVVKPLVPPQTAPLPPPIEPPTDPVTTVAASAERAEVQAFAKNGEQSHWSRWGKQASICFGCLCVGFFLGREYLKWEIRSAFSSAASGFANSLNNERKNTAQATIDPEASAKAAKVKVLGAAISKEESEFGPPKVEIIVNVRNDNTHAISRLYFHGVLKSPNRTVPWCEADFNFSPAGGLEAGETQHWTLTPNMFSGDWSGALEAPEDAKFAVTVKEVEWPR